MGSSAPVLYVNHVSAVSGAEESLLALMRALDREIYEPVLACPPGDLAERAEAAGIRVFPLPLSRFHRTHNPLTVSAYAFSWVLGTTQIKKVIHEVQPKLVHSNSATAQLYAGSMAAKENVPCVWHARDLRRLPFPATSLVRGADRIIAISEAVADILAASGLNRPKVTRIYNGIDVKEWEGRIAGKNVRAELGLSDAERILLVAGQFIPWKRQEDAIRAMEFIAKTHPEARLVLAGSDLFGEFPLMQAQFEQLAAELGVRDKVIFAGQRDDMPDLINAAEMVIVPSDAEPFGRVAMEGMALRKPVVGTRAGGLPELVRDGETGLLVVPRFPQSLAEACVRLLDHPTLAETLGQAGRARVESQFTLDRMVRETQELYKSALHPPLKWIRNKK